MLSVGSGSARGETPVTSRSNLAMSTLSVSQLKTNSPANLAAQANIFANMATGGRRVNRNFVEYNVEVPRPFNLPPGVPPPIIAQAGPDIFAPLAVSRTNSQQLRDTSTWVNGQIDNTTLPLTPQSSIDWGSSLTSQASVRTISRAPSVASVAEDGPAPVAPTTAPLARENTLQHIRNLMGTAVQVGTLFRTKSEDVSTKLRAAREAGLHAEAFEAPMNKAEIETHQKKLGPRVAANLGRYIIAVGRQAVVQYLTELEHPLRHALAVEREKTREARTEMRVLNDALGECRAEADEYKYDLDTKEAALCTLRTRAQQAEAHQVTLMDAIVQMSRQEKKNSAEAARRHNEELAECRAKLEEAKAVLEKTNAELEVAEREWSEAAEDRDQAEHELRRTERALNKAKRSISGAYIHAERLMFFTFLFLLAVIISLNFFA